MQNADKQPTIQSTIILTVAHALNAFCEEMGQLNQSACTIKTGSINQQTKTATIEEIHHQYKCLKHADRRTWAVSFSGENGQYVFTATLVDTKKGFCNCKKQ